MPRPLLRCFQIKDQLKTTSCIPNFSDLMGHGKAICLYFYSDRKEVDTLKPFHFLLFELFL